MKVMDIVPSETVASTTKGSRLPCGHSSRRLPGKPATLQSRCHAAGRFRLQHDYQDEIDDIEWMGGVWKTCR
jgi:hypothetical protein